MHIIINPFYYQQQQKISIVVCYTYLLYVWVLVWFINNWHWNIFFSQRSWTNNRQSTKHKDAVSTNTYSRRSSVAWVSSDSSKLELPTPSQNVNWDCVYRSLATPAISSVRVNIKHIHNCPFHGLILFAYFFKINFHFFE